MVWEKSLQEKSTNWTTFPASPIAAKVSKGMTSGSVNVDIRPSGLTAG